jgi:hypothetical protein
MRPEQICNYGQAGVLTEFTSQNQRVYRARIVAGIDGSLTTFLLSAVAWSIGSPARRLNQSAADGSPTARCRGLCGIVIT